MNPDRRFRNSFAIVICHIALTVLTVSVLSESGVAQTKYDLNGTWIRDDGQQVSVKQNGTLLTAVKITGSKYVPEGDITWEGQYTSNSFPGKGHRGFNNGKEFWVPVHITVVDETTIRVTGFNPDRVYKRSIQSSSGQFGVAMLLAAQNHEGAAYREGMKCSDLIIAASKSIGVQIPEIPNAKGETMTKSWFLHGMGPEYRLILKDAPLSQIAREEGSGSINIPIGSVIVTDGHAALFDGVVKVGSDWQLITYDANDSVGWTVSLSGNPSTTDPSDKMLAFSGHQVGEHVTRLQWGSDHVVSVYQPIGKRP